MASQTIIKVKVPNVLFDLIDQNNTVLDADVICANSTDSDDCDLYF